MDVARRKFPSARFKTAAEYYEAYRAEIIRSWATIDPAAVAAAIEILSNCLERDGTLYVCGNGGSAAIANHLLCDFHKGIQTDTSLKPRVISLSANLELITAIANDISYRDVFLYQLRTLARPGDILLTISSSGDSENIVRAIDWAKSNKIPTIALAGFSGGRSATKADVCLHVAAENFGIVEDIHQSMMHLFAQFLRQVRMDDEEIAERKF